MKERPIIFNTDMVRALLDGRKTQTRRPLKAQPPENFMRGDLAAITDGSKWAISNSGFSGGEKGAWPADPLPGIKCPFGHVGDQLWVRETTQRFIVGEFSVSTYSADGSWIPEEHRWDTAEWWYSKPKCPSIHMPRWASRITLEITSIRVERVQDITEADAIVEGVQPNCSLYDHTNCDHGGEWFRYGGDYDDFPAFSAKESFASLWDEINGPDAWDRNDWVWVIEFKRIEAN